MNDLEIVKVAHGCEVWDYWGNCVFEGTLAQCEEYILDNEGDEE